MAVRSRSARGQRCRSCRRLEAELAQRTKEIEKLKTENASLRAKLEEARRAGKRQAAPFSKEKSTPASERKRSGRRSGAEHGRHGHRQAPTVVDEEHTASLPDACPHCGCEELAAEDWSEQFQDELVTAIVRKRW